MVENKTILVTGASSGIGLSIVKLLANSKAKVVLTGRNESKLQKAISTLEGEGHIYIVADLEHDNNLDLLVNNLPKLDGIVFCAGINEFIPIKFIKREKADKIFNINYFSSIFLLQKILKKKLLNKQSSLVFISSISSILGVPATTLYAASKASVNSTVKVLASELSKLKIRVNAINPGIVITPMLNQENIDTKSLMEQEKLYPLGFGTPEDVAQAVKFHLSTDSRWLTGNIMNLDGGLTLH
ncbi:SDR family oxidoreductase [Flavobacteriaceae bacterium]|nr:SDR family oxidoreductase [Flavobacteriaceae bacterium]